MDDHAWVTSRRCRTWHRRRRSLTGMRRPVPWRRPSLQPSHRHWSKLASAVVGSRETRVVYPSWNVSQSTSEAPSVRQHTRGCRACAGHPSQNCSHFSPCSFKRRFRRTDRLDLWQVLAASLAAAPKLCREKAEQKTARLTSLRRKSKSARRTCRRR